MEVVVKFRRSKNIINFLVLLALSIFSFSNITYAGEVVQESVPQNENANEEVEGFSYAHSPVDLFYLNMDEYELYNIVKRYLATLDHEPELFFQRYIADYEDSSLAAYKDGNEIDMDKKHRKIHKNPILSYRMIWRFAKDMPKIKDILYGSGNPEILEELDKVIDKEVAWPKEKDLNSSMDSLLTLHHIYDLNIMEFAKGNIANVQTIATLSAVHCFEIAQHAYYRNKQYTLAIEWLELADAKSGDVNGHPILDYIEEPAISYLLEEIISDHDKTWVEEAPYFKNLNRYYNKIDSDFDMVTQKRVLKNKFKSRGGSKIYPTNNDISAFTTLCQGGNLQTEKEKSELYCWYESKKHPVWLINPQKMELHSKEPYIFQVYDFIGNDFIRYIKNKSIPLMERATVADVHDGPASDLPGDSSHYSQTRTSMYAWFTEHLDEKILHLNKRIGHLTGLSTHHGFDIPTDLIQIAAYATGGLFNIHIDSLDSTNDYAALIEDNIGDRLATFMIYLNDVEHGGLTAFTSAGVAVSPVKGSALFWYDAKRNGKVDYRSWHGGCPVLLGEKWGKPSVQILSFYCSKFH